MVNLSSSQDVFRIRERHLRSLAGNTRIAIMGAFAVIFLAAMFMVESNIVPIDDILGFGFLGSCALFILA